MKKISNMEMNDNKDNKEKTGLNDPMYDFFQVILAKSVSSFRGEMESFLIDKIGDERLLKIYKDYINSKCLEFGDNFLDEKLLSKEGLENAIQAYFDQSVELGKAPSKPCFFLLLPVKVNSADKETAPRLIICLVDDSGREILGGESESTDLMLVVPNQFKHHAYGLNLQIEASENDISFKENLLIQLNYYRKLFDLDPLS